MIAEMLPISRAPWGPTSKLHTVPMATPPANVEFCIWTMSNLFWWLTIADTTNVVTKYNKITYCNMGEKTEMERKEGRTSININLFVYSRNMLLLYRHSVEMIMVSHCAYLCQIPKIETEIQNQMHTIAELF